MYTKVCKKQSLKHKVNRCVLSLRLNECKLSASRTAADTLFHTTGPATEKTLSPNFVLVRGTVVSAGRMPSGDESMSDHCCTPAQHKIGEVVWAAACVDYKHRQC